MNRRDGDIANDFIGSSVSLARVADMGGARDCGNWQQQQQQQQARGGVRVVREAAREINTAPFFYAHFPTAELQQSFEALVFFMAVV